ncbi:MAG: hypothetical protein JXR73_09380 [Candidatus Omnitrophica bacterium]|nr:hypothetical protein [Candidatus Omnitrophota bacterium]
MNLDLIRDVLIQIGRRVRERVYHSLTHQSLEERTSVHAETEEDTIYQIDRDVESIILPELNRHAAALNGVILIAEGIGDEDAVALPHGCDPRDAALRILMDPIDGTRGIMYDKRSAFFLAGAAPNRDEAASLRDVVASVMVELPTSRSYLSDEIWALRGQGAHRSTYNMKSGEIEARKIAPSQSKTLLGGFGQISRFFPPAKEILARIEDQLIERLFPDAPAGRAILFEDQYISTGGQLYEMLVGHDRFVADLRASLYRRIEKEGRRIGLTCHPYDVAAHNIAQEAGVIVTDARGADLDPPLTTTGAVDWIAYANPSIRDEIQPVLMDLLREQGLIE